LQKHRAKIAKLFGLSHDVMRHTFISMFVGKFRSMGEAALQAGNSESIIRKHYLDLKTAAEADLFLASCPNAPVSPHLTLFRPHQHRQPSCFSQPRDPYGQRAPNIRNTGRVGFDAPRPVCSKR
jgi:hypothetical protein